jgi:hypothetical protein
MAFVRLWEGEASFTGSMKRQENSNMLSESRVICLAKDCKKVNSERKLKCKMWDLQMFLRDRVWCSKNGKRNPGDWLFEMEMRVTNVERWSSVNHDEPQRANQIDTENWDVNDSPQSLTGASPRNERAKTRYLHHLRIIGTSHWFWMREFSSKLQAGDRPWSDSPFSAISFLRPIEIIEGRYLVPRQNSESRLRQLRVVHFWGSWKFSLEAWESL